MHISEKKMKKIRKLIRDNNQVVCKVMVVEVCKVMVVGVCKVMAVGVCKVMVEVVMVVVKVEVVMVVVKAEVIMVEVEECNHQTGLILEVSSLSSHILMQDHQTPIQ